MNRAVAFARQVARAEVRAATRARHDYEDVYVALRSRLRDRFGPALKSARVLDFGCGFTYPLLVLLQEDVGEIVGVDVGSAYRDGLRCAIEAGGGLRKPGGTAAAVLEYAQASRYYHHLTRHASVRVRHHEYQVVRYPGDRLPFSDSSFDCIISNAVLQELPLPLEQFAAEMARVLKPGGLIDLEWHNFYSWSGHYKGELESRRMPWGHLRGGPFHPCLNRVTPTDAEAAFAPHFHPLRLLGHDRHYRMRGRDASFEPEGQEFLTPELAEQLHQYPAEWLLTRGYILQGDRRTEEMR
jgi:SAM-dependent methyltransferase